MGYKVKEKDNEYYFKYTLLKNKIKKYTSKKEMNDNPFSILKNISFK